MEFEHLLELIGDKPCFGLNLLMLIEKLIQKRTYDIEAIAV